MDPDFKDLLPWQEMSQKIKELEAAFYGLSARTSETDAMLQRGIDRLDRNIEMLQAQIASLWRAINELQSYHN